MLAMSISTHHTKLTIAREPLSANPCLVPRWGMKMRVPISVALHHLMHASLASKGKGHGIFSSMSGCAGSRGVSFLLHSLVPYAKDMVKQSGYGQRRKPPIHGWR